MRASKAKTALVAGKGGGKPNALPAWQTDPEACFFGRTPLPQQRDFLEQFRKHGMEEGGYGGAVGGGKTVGLAFIAAWMVTAFPGSVGLLGRRHKQSLVSTTLPEFQAMQIGLEENYGLECEFLEGINQLRFKFFTGEMEHECSQIICVEMKDATKFQGASVDYVLMDEAPQIPAASWQQAYQRLRGSVHNPSTAEGAREWPVFLAWAGNPAPGYAHRQFVVPHEQGKLGKGEHAKRFFIPCRSADNPYNERGYVGRMIGAGVDRNMIDGIWDFSRGNALDAPASCFRVFDEYRVTGASRGTSPQAFGYDFGTLHEAAILKGFIHDGVLYVDDEKIERGMEIEDAAAWIRDKGDGPVYADQTTAWQVKNPRGGRQVEAVATLFQREGVSLTKANEGAKKDVFSTVRMLKDMLRRGCVVVHSERCPLLCEAIQNWSHEVDEKTGEYDPRKYSEVFKDRIDALRYLVINVEPDLTYKPVQAEEEDAATAEAMKPAAERNWVDSRNNAWVQGMYKTQRLKNRGIVDAPGPVWVSGVEAPDAVDGEEMMPTFDDFSGPGPDVRW